MAEIGQRAKVKVSQLGKWKTTAQMLAIGMLLYREDLPAYRKFDCGYGLLYIAAILTLWSMVNYLSAALAAIDGKINTLLSGFTRAFRIFTNIQIQRIESAVKEENGSGNRKYSGTI